MQPHLHVTDQTCADPVRFRHPPKRIGKGPCPARIDPDRRNPSSNQGCAKASRTRRTLKKATRPLLRETCRAKASRSLFSIRAYPSGPTTSIQLFAPSTPNSFSKMIPLFQSHGNSANCVRRRHQWDRWLPDLRDGLTHPVALIRAKNDLAGTVRWLSRRSNPWSWCAIRSVYAEGRSESAPVSQLTGDVT